MSLTIHHVLIRLLREGVIYASGTPKLFEVLLEHRAALQERLSELGMELVVIQDAGVAHARNLSEEALDRLAEALDCDPISPVCSHHRLSHYESTAAMFFRASLDQELRQGGEEIWITQGEVHETLAKDYSEAVAEDRVALEDRIKRVLSRLQELGLVAVRPMGPATRYRGRGLLLAAFSRDDLRAYTARMTALADAGLAGAPPADDEAPTTAEIQGAEPETA